MLYHCSAEYQPTLKKVPPRELHYIPLAPEDRDDESIYRIGAILEDGKYEPKIKGGCMGQGRVSAKYFGRRSMAHDEIFIVNFDKWLDELSGTYQFALDTYNGATAGIFPGFINNCQSYSVGKFGIGILSTSATKKDVNLLDRFNKTWAKAQDYTTPDSAIRSGLIFHSIVKDSDRPKQTKEQAVAKARELAQAQKTAALTATILSYNPILQVAPLPSPPEQTSPRTVAGNRFAQIKDELQQLKEQSLINPSAQVCLQIKQLIIELRQLVRKAVRRLEFMLRLHTRPIYQEPANRPLHLRSIFRYLYKYMNDVTGCEDDHAVLLRRKYSNPSINFKALFQWLTKTSSSAYWMKLSTIPITSYQPMK
jgi:hypothetical protein